MIYFDDHVPQSRRRSAYLSLSSETSHGQGLERSKRSWAIGLRLRARALADLLDDRTLLPAAEGLVRWADRTEPANTCAERDSDWLVSGKEEYLMPPLRVRITSSPHLPELLAASTRAGYLTVQASQDVVEIHRTRSEDPQAELVAFLKTWNASHPDARADLL
jgi:hypothetical protein